MIRTSLLKNLLTKKLSNKNSLFSQNKYYSSIHTTLSKEKQ